jgi:hypothetical protein
VHRISLAVAGPLVLLTAWAFVAAGAVYDSRYERLVARSPIFSASAHRAGRTARRLFTDLGAVNLWVAFSGRGRTVTHVRGVDGGV